MIDNDFIMDNKNKFFPNAFSFTDANAKTSNSLMDKYGNRSIYLKKSAVFTSSAGQKVRQNRYTHFKIKEIKTDVNSPISTLELTNETGEIFTFKTTFKSTNTANIILQSDNYFHDMFGTGNLKAQYPDISNELWQTISQGEVRKGMTTDECRLSLGDPIRIHRIANDESWYYQKKCLDFTNKKLVRIH